MATCWAASVIADAAHLNRCARCRASWARCSGPFEAYLAMRGIKTFPLRMERQCANACRIASWLADATRGRARLFPGRIPSIPTPTRSAASLHAQSLRRGGQLRTEERRKARRRFPLHERAENDRARDFGWRRAHHDAVSGDEFASRDFAEAPRAHGNPRKSGPALRRNRSRRGHHRRYRAAR